MAKRFIICLALLLTTLAPGVMTANATQARERMCEFQNTLPTLCRGIINEDPPGDMPASIMILVIQFDSPDLAIAEIDSAEESARNMPDGEELELEGLPVTRDARAFSWTRDAAYFSVIIGTVGNNSYMIRGANLSPFSSKGLVDIHGQVVEALPDDAELTLDMLPTVDDLPAGYSMESESITTIERRTDTSSPEADERDAPRTKGLRKVAQEATEEPESQESSTRTRRGESRMETPAATSEADHPYPGLTVLEVTVDDAMLEIVVENESDTHYREIMVQIICENAKPNAPDFYLILPEIGPQKTPVFTNMILLAGDCGDVTIEFVSD